jgi:hypothetical protein
MRLISARQGSSTEKNYEEIAEIPAQKIRSFVE